MNKNDLIKLLDGIFSPLGFKRKGNNWLLNGEQLSKIVNIQRSSYSNAFYINYGYIIRALPLLNVRMHVENRLASTSKIEQKRITNLLDFEIGINKEKRLAELKVIITEKIVAQMQSINIEEELLNELRQRSHLNDISLIVKRHFNLQEEEGGE